jgi:hypothetical protein
LNEIGVESWDFGVIQEISFSHDLTDIENESEGIDGNQESSDK